MRFGILVIITNKLFLMVAALTCIWHQQGEN